MHIDFLNNIPAAILSLFTLLTTGLFIRTDAALRASRKELRWLRQERERKEFEKQVAVLEARQKEKNRIAADLHDELGSGITAILLMSELLRSGVKENVLPQIEKISSSARELLERMGMIIWTMVSTNDNVESLAAYIRNYAIEFFENTPVTCHFDMPLQASWQALSSDRRRNLFLCVKETFNNVLKHAKADSIHITILVEKKLVIEIRDNGIGIDPAGRNKSGNGLANIHKRMQSIQGIAWLQNEEGTKVTLELSWESKKPGQSSQP